ncbi:hypothetical protein GH811_19080 [Acetobacterium malicum]|uniref:Uncharacterized protein n=1 Tax=Acetobacterium malicum TaxID=52692 RepID=A0ABR6Z2W5_9FIRM|nr:hypothetical protein [Acetobacterium malicum]MBC3901696.1 hypothetical protein [Acetobacterium malicum]
MFRNRILKILSLLMVLNILIIPLTSFTPQHQNKYKVYAAEGIVDIRFFNAIVSMIGITSVMIGSMSDNFSIPAADLTDLKDQFAQSLETDSTRKAAWMSAQTEYLAGGVAKTMGAVELAKIGINDIYDQINSYLNTHIINIDTPVEATSITTETPYYISVSYLNSPINYMKYTPTSTYTLGSYSTSNPYWRMHDPLPTDTRVIYSNTFYSNGSEYAVIRMNSYYNQFEVNVSITNATNPQLNAKLYQECLRYGIDITQHFTNLNLTGAVKGYVNYTDSENIINTTETTRSIIPTIPWIDTTIPVGTIVTPAISVPYAGVVPIDVPLTVPIDPPIDEPVDPPVEDNIAGTVAAILAGLTPIAGFLEYILAGQVSLTDTIESGITGVIDGIGDIAGTLTGGITSSLTDIQTSISSLLDPPTETLDLDKLKNLNSVLFTKFPFSIPFDFIAIVTAINADPVAPVLTIPFNMQDFGGSNSNIEIDLSIYDNFANKARQIGFIGFVIFMLFNTRKLIWK